MLSVFVAVFYNLWLNLQSPVTTSAPQCTVSRSCPLQLTLLTLQEREAAQMLDQLREITGVQDDEVLSRALMDSRASSGSYDVARAVALLVDGCQTADQPTEPVAPRAAQPAPKVGTAPADRCAGRVEALEWDGGRGGRGRIGGLIWEEGLVSYVSSLDSGSPRSVASDPSLGIRLWRDGFRAPPLVRPLLSASKLP